MYEKIKVAFTDKKFRNYAILSFFICLFYAIVFEPITWQARGDAPAYIELAKQFLGISEENTDLSHRQPLYSVFISPFILMFGVENFTYPVIWSQFFLIFITSLMIYKILENMNLKGFLPFIGATIFLINISTIHYGFSILSETLALFLFVFIVLLLIKFTKTPENKYLYFIGILSGLLVLTRFNTIGLPLFVISILAMIHFRVFGVRNIKGLIMQGGIYLISLFFVLNFWMLYNYTQRGFYGVYQQNNPRVHIPVYERVGKDLIISDENKEVFNIFLDAKNRIIEKNAETTPKKGSLLNIKFVNQIYTSLNFMRTEARGWAIYNEAKPDLLDHFNLAEENPASITLLSKYLKPFVSEVRSQTLSIEMTQRFSALIETFRHTGGPITGFSNLNINILPDWIFLGYRLLALFVFSTAFIISAFFLVSQLPKIQTSKNFVVIILSFLIIYFPLSHFYAISQGDSNRFKFIAEPILIGLFIFYIQLGFGWFKNKYFKHLQ